MKSLSLRIAGRIVRFGRLALNMNRRIFCQTAAALALLLSLTVRAGDWPQFRGPGGNGVAQEYKAPLHWDRIAQTAPPLGIDIPSGMKSFQLSSRLLIANPSPL